MKGDGLQGGEGGRSAGKGREEKRRVDGGIKGVARQGFRTHTLPRTLFPQGALDALTRNARMRVNTRGRCVRLRFAIFDRKKSRKANPISTISLSADPGFHLVRHLLRSCRIGWRGWEEEEKKNEATTCQTVQMKALKCPERIRGSVGFPQSRREKRGKQDVLYP